MLLASFAMLVGGFVYSMAAGLLYGALTSSLMACALAVVLQPAGPTPLESERPFAVRRAAVALLAVLTAVYRLQALSLAAVSFDRPPAAWQTRAVSVFPYRVDGRRGGRGVFEWATQWRDTGRTLEWLHWGHRHSVHPIRYFLFEGRLLAGLGRVAEARARFDRALELARSDGERARVRRTRARSLRRQRARQPTGNRHLIGP